MTTKFKKSGQKIVKRFSRFSKKASIEGKEHIEENVVRRISHVREVRLNVIEWFLLVFAITMLAITQSNWYSDSYSLSSFVSGGTFTEGTLGKVSTLNPLFATTNSEKTISRLLFASLSENDYSGHAGLGLADSIIPSEDGKVWNIHLRENLKWSDGEPLTVSDVLFTVNLIKSSAVSTLYSSNLTGVDVSESGDNMLKFELPVPYADFLSALNFPILPEHILRDIEPKKLAESAFSKNPVSSGAFSFTASQTLGTQGEAIIYLAANDYYYRGRPMLDSFAVHAFLSEDSIISALNSGSITATAELSQNDSSKIISEKIYEKQTSIKSGVFAFLNTSSNILKNKSIRQAIQKGINIEEIREVAGVVPDLDYPILNSQIQISSIPDIPSYDQQSAKAIIYDAGITTDSTPISIVTVKSGSLPAVSESFADNLRDLGFSVDVMAYDATQDFVTNILRTRAYDILIYEIDFGAEVDPFPYYHSSQATSLGLNLSNYNNSLVDDILLAARETTDINLRSAKYEAFLKYWVSEVPAIGLYQTNISYFYNKNSRTFSEDTKLIIPTDRFAEVEYWSVEKSVLNRTP